MVTISIFPPDDFKAFAGALVAEPACGSTREYLRERIRKQRDNGKLRALPVASVPGRSRR